MAATASYATMSDPDGNGVAVPGGHHAVAWARRRCRDFVCLGKRFGRRDAASLGRAWRAREAHRWGRPGLARLVRRVHGARTERSGDADMSDFDVIVLGG